MNKRRLHSLETAIRPPTMQELSADERVVLTMLQFQKHIMPDWLRRAEERRDTGRPPPSHPSHVTAQFQERWDRVFQQIREANARLGKLSEQGRLENIIERLKAWGHWQEPDPAPPDAVAIIEQLRVLTSR